MPKKFTIIGAGSKFSFGIAADLINSSRSVMEDVSFRLRRMEAEQQKAAEETTAEARPNARREPS